MITVISYILTFMGGATFGATVLAIFRAGKRDDQRRGYDALDTEHFSRQHEERIR